MTDARTADVASDILPDAIQTVARQRPFRHVARLEKIANVSTEEFVRVMVTNALSPMRVIEVFKDLVPSTGTIGVMSSGQGSVANNTNGKYEAYRSSKAALNMLMRSVAARHHDDPRTLLLMAPGWVRTAMGGA